MRCYRVLVIFEGLDNCGKTTLVQMIKDYYSKLGIDAEVSKEFETNIGKELKNMAKVGTLDPILKAYLFATDRYIRYVFAQSKDNLGRTLYRFLGEYTLNREKTIKEQKAIWERTNTRVKTFKYKFEHFLKEKCFFTAYFTEVKKCQEVIHLAER